MGQLNIPDAALVYFSLPTLPILRSQEARSPEKLDQAINEAINSVTDKDIIGWLTHCCYYASSN
jgi:hypothetical protein